MTRRMAGLAAGLMVLASGAVVAPLSSSAGASARPPAHPLVQTGHTTFWECPKKTTQILVAVNTLTLHPGATLSVNFTVRNGAATPCNYTAPYAGVAPGPTASTLQAGPCGSVGLKVLGAHRRNVWPGTQVVNCPALGFAQLPSDGTISGVGSWDQTRPNSTKRVPVGSYTLVVDHFSFPLRVVSR